MYHPRQAPPQSEGPRLAASLCLNPSSLRRSARKLGAPARCSELRRHGSATTRYGCRAFLRCVYAETGLLMPHARCSLRSALAPSSSASPWQTASKIKCGPPWLASGSYREVSPHREGRRTLRPACRIKRFIRHARTVMSPAYRFAAGDTPVRFPASRFYITKLCKPAPPVSCCGEFIWEYPLRQWPIRA